MRAGLALRWGRAAVLAAVAGTTGMLAHLGAGGLLPGALGMVLVFGSCLMWSAALLGRPATRRRVVLMVVACQTFTHGALTAMAGHRGDHVVAGAASSRAALPVPTPQPVTVLDGTGRAPWEAQMHAANPTAGAPVQLSVPAPVQHLLADFTGPHAAMACAHLLGAVLVGLWLARGEQLLWSLISLGAQTAGSVIHALVAALNGPAVSRYDVGALLVGRRGTAEACASEPTRWFTTATARRGPPALAGI
jgi:hypothetical protein